METGYRVDADGRVLPRDIVRRFECRYDGELVFGADLFPAIAANPYLAFSALAVDSGTLVFLGRRPRLRAPRAARDHASHETPWLLLAWLALPGGAVAAAPSRAGDGRRSGFDFMGPTTRRCSATTR